MLELDVQPCGWHAVGFAIIVPIVIVFICCGVVSVGSSPLRLATVTVMQIYRADIAKMNGINLGGSQMLGLPIWFAHTLLLSRYPGERRAKACAC